MKKYVAIDLGASNGRSILGQFNGERLSLKELNRFENNYVRIGDSYYWDVLHLYTSIKEGLKKYAKTNSDALFGIGIDTWGVDFGLIDNQGRLVGNPRAYRDARGLRGMQAFNKKYGERTLFDISGVADVEFNTTYQIYDMVQTDDPQLKAADKLLLMPDLLTYMLCGEVSCEYTHASTTQMLDVTGKWSKDIVDMLGIKKSLLPKIQLSGEKKGNLLYAIKNEIGLKDTMPVYCVGSHDTASAVASIPAKNENFAFISSGTWSLMGIVSDSPFITDNAYKNNFSNEGTVDGRYRTLRNIMGLWIIQSCKRQWDLEEKISWNDIVDRTKAAPAFLSFIDVNDHVFFDAGNMTQKIQTYCENIGQPVPQTKGEVARTVYESLALSYKEAFDGLEQLKGSRIDVLHIVGGGSKNTLLNQMTANAIGREVIAGPAEAAAIGNLMVQVKSSGEVRDMAQMRQVICDSFSVESYEPQEVNEWIEQYERYITIKEKQIEGQ